MPVRHMHDYEFVIVFADTILISLRRDFLIYISGEAHFL